MMLIFEYNNHTYKQSEIDKKISDFYNRGIYSQMTAIINEKTAHLRKEIQKEGGTFRIKLVKEGVSIYSEGLSPDLMSKIEQAITTPV